MSKMLFGGSAAKYIPADIIDFSAVFPAKIHSRLCDIYFTLTG